MNSEHRSITVPSDPTLHIVFVAEGFTAKDKPLFHAAAEKLAAGLVKLPTFNRNKEHLAFDAVFVESAVSGISSAKGVKMTPFLVQKDYAGVARSLGCAWDLPILNVVAKHLPGKRTQAVIVANDTSHAGCGGRVVMVTRHGDNVKTLAHELGHSAGALDEYTTEYAHWPRFAGPNLALTNDPQRVPWSDQIGQPDGVGGKVGIFEGGGYHKKGIWRPTKSGCGMAALGKPFCAVCDRAVDKWIKGT